MPFLSKRQARFAFSNPDKFGGTQKVKEWADKTDFKKLPERKARKRRGKK